jgi:predicted DNA binding protein
MSVIAHLRVPADSFELGRILDIGGGTSVELENFVPIGERAVPFFSVHGSVRGTFETEVQNHPSVSRVREISAHEDKVLYALDWEVSRDLFFQGLYETDAHLLSGTGGPETWEFELRFPTHEALAEFQEYCSDATIPLEVGRIYNPTRPDSGPFYGLTPPQRDTLVRAVEGGYYSIPREMSTKDLAEEFDISDQAVTERLRRAISTLVDNSLVAAIEERAEFQPSDAESRSSS